MGRHRLLMSRMLWIVLLMHLEMHLMRVMHPMPMCLMLMMWTWWCKGAHGDHVESDVWSSHGGDDGGDDGTICSHGDVDAYAVVDDRLGHLKSLMMSLPFSRSQHGGTPADADVAGAQAFDAVMEVMMMSLVLEDRYDQSSLHQPLVS